MCFSPVTVINPYPKAHSIQVPCGHCLECLKDYQNSWFVRLYNQALDSQKVLFVTLTYRDEVLPYVVDTDTGEFAPSVCLNHIQKALKRFRSYNDKHGLDLKFKYFICSEYGPTTLRPHYHCLIFGLSYFEFLPFLKDWQDKFGFVKCDTVQFAKDNACKVARYVSKYCSKGMFENPYVKLGLCDKTFRVVSKGIGSGYIDRCKAFHLGKISFKGRKFDKSCKKYFGYSEEYISFLYHNSKVVIDSEAQGQSFRYKMPRYYKQKIYGSKNFLSVAMSNFAFEEHCDIYNRKLGEIQSLWHCTEAEAVRQISMQDIDDKKQRYKELSNSLKHFYFTSKL